MISYTEKQELLLDKVEKMREQKQSFNPQYLQESISSLYKEEEIEQRIKNGQNRKQDKILEKESYKRDVLDFLDS